MIPRFPGRAVCGWALVLAVAGLVPCVHGAERKARETGFLRIERSDAGDEVALQVARRAYRPRSGRKGPVIWLTGVTHIGSSNYFAALQKHLDTLDLVLYEGVNGGPESEPASEPSGPGEKKLDHGLQGDMAQALGLVFQLEAIDYRKPHFRNSDLSLDQIQQLLAPPGVVLSDAPAAAGPPPRAHPQLEHLVNTMNGTSLLGRILDFGLRLVAGNPRLQAVTKLVLIETLGQLEGDLTEARGLPPDLKELLTVLIRARNDTVLRTLAREASRPEGPKSISVFYGAAHMADLEQRLARELGYSPAGTEWETAFAVNLRSQGVAPAEALWVRRMVGWQLQQLDLGGEPPAGSQPLQSESDKNPNTDTAPAPGTGVP